MIAETQRQRMQRCLEEVDAHPDRASAYHNLALAYTVSGKVRLAEDMSLAPGCEDLRPGEVSGLLLTHLGEIWVDATEAGQWDTRRRFTVGHEVGHYLIHRDDRPQIFCRRVDIIEDEEPPRTGPAPKPLPELEADAFAAALLMPEHLIRSHAGQCGRDLEEMKRRFNCSHKAMSYRLTTVT